MKLSFGKQNGISTLEMMIAMALIVLSISAVMLLVFGSQSTSVDSNRSNEAIYLAQQQLENVRAQARASFANAVSAGPFTQNGYTKQVTVTNMTDPSTGLPDPFRKLVLSSVSWQVSGKAETINLSTIVADWHANLSGDICQVPAAANWANPTLLNSTALNIGTNNTATATAVRGNYVYLAASGTDTAKRNFFVIDVSNKQNPQIKASLTASSFPQAEIDSIFLSGNYAYVIGYPHSGGFNDQGGTVFVSNGYAYVGTTRTDLTQFAIIDISKPLTPTVVSNSKIVLPKGYEIVILDVSNPGTAAPAVKYKYNNITNQVNLIQVYNQKAYISNEGFDTSGAILPNGSHLPNGAGFTILDVSNVANAIPPLVGYFDSGDHGYGMVTRDPAHILLGGHGGSLSKGLHMLDATNPMAVQDVDQIIGANGRLSGIISSGNYAFLGTQDKTKVFTVVDITDPTNMQFVAGIGFDSNSVKAPAAGLDCQNNVFYLATDSSSDALKIIGPGAVATAQVLNFVNGDVTGSSVQPSTAIHEHAIIAGGGLVIPTGTVDFKQYSNSTCTTLVSTQSGVALDSNGEADSNPSTPAIGTYYYKVHYNGDTTYTTPVDSDCVSVTVVKYTPTLAIEIHNPAEAVVTTVIANTQVHSKATVTGSGTLVPTGTVKFNFYNNSTCSGGVTNAGTITLNASGVAHPSNTIKKGAGSYSFNATYNGDANYNSATSACSPLTVN